MPRRADLLWTALAVVVSLAALRLDATAAEQGGRPADLLGAALAIAACAPLAVRRAHPLGSAVAALPLAGAALALGYTVVPPILIALMLCGRAAVVSPRRITVPLAAYAGSVMAPAVAITGDDGAVLVQMLGGLAIGVTAVLIGDAIRSERERTREAQESADRIARLRDRDVERAVVEERLRIARDVHDITGHHLSAISLQAAGAGRTSADPVARAALERIHGLTSEALGQTRRALGVLREPGLAVPADRAPTPRLQDVEALLGPARDAGIVVDLRVDRGDLPLPDELAVCAYRVVQESLTNVVRHADAGTVRVRIAREERRLVIAVDDDGPGDGPVRPGGGLEGMRRRVAIIGGTFSAGPTGDGVPGWSVRASLPLDPDLRDRAGTSAASRVAP